MCACTVMVAQWLVEQANCLFSGFKDYLITLTDTSLTYTVDTSIHHVKCWGSLLERDLLERYLCNKMNIGCVYNETREQKEEIKTKIKEGIGIAEMKNSEFYKEIASYGKNCQKNYVDFKWVSA
jgi:hypothetical protein